MSEWYKMSPVDWNDGTDDLTLEQEAAYLRICHAIYISERPVRDNSFVIAGLLRCNDRRAKRLLSELIAAGKLVSENGLISNRRAVEEVSNRRRIQIERASAGSRGGVESGKARAKSLKDKGSAEAIASTPNEPDKKREDKKAASQQEAREPPDKLYDRLIDAAGSRGGCHPNLAMGIQPIVDLIRQNYDLDRDILPVVRERAGPDRRSWSYFATIIVDRVRQRNEIPVAPTAPKFDWRKALDVFREGTWAAGWGPKPGENGCRVPAELLVEYGFVRAA